MTIGDVVIVILTEVMVCAWPRSRTGDSQAHVFPFYDVTGFTKFNLDAEY